MARLLPSDISELSLSLGETAELRTLEALRSGLPSAYTVFHSVHWAYHTAFGEADFIVVNQSGEVVVIEQKSGALDESAGGLIKQYSDGIKGFPG
jgi:Nuclease-related domain